MCNPSLCFFLRRRLCVGGKGGVQVGQVDLDSRNLNKALRNLNSLSAINSCFLFPSEWNKTCGAALFFSAGSFCGFFFPFSPVCLLGDNSAALFFPATDPPFSPPTNLDESSWWFFFPFFFFLVLKLYLPKFPNIICGSSARLLSLSCSQCHVCQTDAGFDCQY